MRRYFIVIAACIFGIAASLVASHILRTIAARTEPLAPRGLIIDFDQPHPPRPIDWSAFYRHKAQLTDRLAAILILGALGAGVVGAAHAVFSLAGEMLRSPKSAAVAAGAEVVTALAPGCYCTKCQPDGLGIAAICTTCRGKT